MPWRSRTITDERARFVLDAQGSFLSFSELCRRYQISRPTGYKWLQRYQEGGLGALHDHSHQPRSCPHATPPEVVTRILELRRHRGWGAPKIRCLLEREFAHVPCTDTIYRILQRHGFITPSKPRRTRTHTGPPAAAPDVPNAVWTADFKGQFRMLDGRLCYPLTVQDHATRFLLDCKGLAKLELAATLHCFDVLFRTYGLPERIRTDNGHPFASSALGRLSQLSLRCIHLGTRPEFIEPGKPQQNGRHERMHRTLKAETARPPAKNLRAQQRRFERFQHTYSEERPHQALRQKTPGSIYLPSVRPFPDPLPEVSYPEHFEVRTVSQDATMRWKGRKVCVSHLLIRESVGIEELDDGVWSVYFGPVHLGWLDERDYRIMDVRGQERTR